MRVMSVHNPVITASRIDCTMPDQIVTVSVGFEDLYRQEYPGLIAVATALTGTVEDAEDVVQGTMLKAFAQWGKVRRLDRPGGWCHRVLVNASSPGPSADALAFWAAVRQLPERPRQVVALYYAGDCPVEDVARILAVPEGTVRSDLTRARAALRIALEDDHEY